MALSGSLDTFALPDVLRLLASTSKTGRLRITGDRGSGSVWVDAGEVVATELASAASREPNDAEVVFGLLRFTVGSFTFEVDAATPDAGSPSAMEPILDTAESMLAEWRAIEEVIGSLDEWVALRPELEGPDVMVDGTRWRAIAAIGSGAQVGAVAEQLGLNEIDACRLVKELVEFKLVDLIDKPADVVASTTFEPEPEAFEVPDVGSAGAEPGSADEAGADAAEEPEADELAPSDTGVVPSLASLEATDDPLVESESADDDREDDLDDDISDTDEGADVFAGAVAGADDDDLDPAEMARQLANLSPKAAKAVAAAAKADTDAERDEALAAVEAEDETVNRGLLLRFLGSVDS